MNKTVYILGAGFSMEAGSPSQEKLVESIFNINKTDPNVFGSDEVKTFKKFLSRTMNVPSRFHNQVPLEDIFTPLDRCMLDNTSFRNLNQDQIKKATQLVYYLIGKTLQYLLAGPDKRYIDMFATYLVAQGSKRMHNEYKNIDSVSVISTNWDILLDSSIQSKIDNLFPMKGVIDYCCYVSSYWKDDERIKPGLEMLGSGGFNVKLLKLHGSLNWLQCPRCLRVYVDSYNKIAIDQYLHPVRCRHCDKNFETLQSHELSSNVIMPTFLKNLSNPQYKLIWQNAGVELAEASKIIFIGYSLPTADFEMRQLLSRMIRNNAEILVVDYGKPRDAKIKETKKRYNVFFGRRKIKYFLHGAKEYIYQTFGG